MRLVARRSRGRERSERCLAQSLAKICIEVFQAERPALAACVGNPAAHCPAGSGAGVGCGRRGPGNTLGGVIAKRAISQSTGRIEQPIVSSDTRAWTKGAYPSLLLAERKTFQPGRRKQCGIHPIAASKVALDAEDERSVLVIVTELGSAKRAPWGRSARSDRSAGDQGIIG